MTDTRVYPLFARTAARSAQRRTRVALAGGALLAVILSGCSASNEPTPTESAVPTTGASAEPTPSASPSSAPTPTPTPTPKGAGSPIAQSCGDLLTLQNLYDFNPNYGTAAAYSPTPGGLVETATTYNGLTCGYSNQSSGELIELSVVAPNAVLMTTLKQQADASSQAVPTYGTPPTVDGFFNYTGGSGQAQVFTGTYWVTLSSPAFYNEPGAAEGLMSKILGHLG